METISTKVDRKTAKQFIEYCNQGGKCQSEVLRELIENICEKSSNDVNLPRFTQDLKMTSPTNSIKSRTTPKPTVSFIFD
jgi:hypothetical protein